MKFETSELAQLVVAYRKKFEKHVPLPALKLLAVDLVPILMEALATNTALAETGWMPIKFGLRGGCIIGRARPSKGPDGEWLH